jgi:hypothetical protein
LMPLVRVHARKDFEHEGIRYISGEAIAMTALDAAVLSRQGLVNLSKQNIQTREMAPEPEPELVPVRRRRSYKRADMTAETTE